jgi:hypothetical protein
VIVLDPSALVELLIGTATGRIIAARISDPAIGKVAEASDVTWSAPGRRAWWPADEHEVDVWQSDAIGKPQRLGHPGLRSVHGEKRELPGVR